MSELPKFKGREIVPRVTPKNICAGILGGKFGKAIDGRIQKKYGDLSAISKIGYNDELEEVVGSNILYAIGVNEFVREDGKRTMTVDDYKQIKNSDSLDLSRNYEDIGIVVRGLEGYNADFAKKFIAGKNFSLPITVNLADCRLERDEESEHGLVILPGDEIQVIPGDVADYRGSAALSGLCSGWDLDLASPWDALAYSNSAGRVVVVEEQ